MSGVSLGQSPGLGSAIGLNAGGGGGAGHFETPATSAETVGVSTANSRGTQITADASAHTKGAYVELTAATSNDWTGVILSISRPNGEANYMVDIATGAAASETDIISNFLYCSTVDTMDTTLVYFPLDVPSGTRISARCQSDVGSRFIDVSLVGFVGGNSTGNTSVVTLNADTANTRGAFIDLAATGANTKSSYVEIVASAAASYSQLYVNINTNNLSQTADTNCLTDIAFGAAASEVDFLSNISTKCDGNADRSTTIVGALPISITSGDRLSCRAQTDQSAAGASVTVQLLALS